MAVFLLCLLEGNDNEPERSLSGIQNSFWRARGSSQYPQYFWFVCAGEHRQTKCCWAYLLWWWWQYWKDFLKSVCGGRPYTVTAGLKEVHASWVYGRAVDSLQRGSRKSWVVCREMSRAARRRIDFPQGESSAAVFPWSTPRKLLSWLEGRLEWKEACVKDRRRALCWFTSLLCS